MNATSSRLDKAIETVKSALLDSRNSEGHWQGHLSSSALSTATAICALAIAERGGAEPAVGAAGLIGAGLRWLANHQNADGGWGDTTLSVSNMSTAALCWAAFGAVPGADSKYASTVQRAVAWLGDHAGSIKPEALSKAIIGRYGKDRTFSVPILTMCALAGRLGPEPACWRFVLPLPFELAAFPARWFAALKLPVVSYALPALIAIGQARHVHLPTRNPITRLLRGMTRSRTLNVLEWIQPSSGGFLEATPLTSFVVMSLASSGQVNHPVTRNGLKFLKAAARPDGSWAIDTNLATWVTTLSIQALWLASPGGAEAIADLPDPERIALKQWLLDQQFAELHPYTNAAPGGWAWTPLPGGVPDADDTAGALLALRHLGRADEPVKRAATAGLKWLVGLQNKDGGIPTFCRGWGALPFDRSSPDLTAHALRAWVAWKDLIPSQLAGILQGAIQRALAYLEKTQRPDGSWIPLWFGNQYAPDDENPIYGTARVLMALCDVANAGLEVKETLVEQAAEWLVRNQGSDGGWGAYGGAAASVEETALALDGLAAISPGKSRIPVKDALSRGTEWMLQRIESGCWTSPSPIGFYFAKLWYYEKLYPVIFTAAALGRLKRYRDNSPPHGQPENVQQSLA